MGGRWSSQTASPVPSCGSPVRRPLTETTLLSPLYPKATACLVEDQEALPTLLLRATNLIEPLCAAVRLP